MVTKKEKLTEQLNSLVEINNDRILGYEKAVEDTDDFELKRLFHQMASHSRIYRAELSNEVRKLGGQPTDKTRTSGKIFRVWMDIKAALTGKDRKAIIHACETGEDAAIEAYTSVLELKDVLTSSLRDLISKQKSGLQEDHDHIRSLRDSVVL